MAALPSFDKAVWSYVWRDFKSGLCARTRMVTEALLSFGVTFVLLARLGSSDAPFDLTVEKLLAVPLIAVVMMLIHGLWSWARAPRKIYYEQQQRIRTLGDQVSDQQGYEDKCREIAELIEEGNNLDTELSSLIKRGGDTDDTKVKVSQWQDKVMAVCEQGYPQQHLKLLSARKRKAVAHVAKQKSFEIGRLRRTIEILSTFAD